ncbi:chitooligosaccharide synthase NodC [Sinorhizobium medicae]|uniref:N-acetylglucosaminyltransferase n=17 Tax=Hyphomicrobiales TaxID=356 RepID=A4GTD3_9HYPH|nr:MULTISPECIES: chitooligosaccharide synthase NodC [Sinorhizobium/Ensifer group]ABO30365.1 N-acetylglucosaminyltransferase [Sinorhizobium medicae]ABR64803.1 glycosyl transferase family 2 [Sinorhizobium medicae WSM419]MBM3096136.1 chitooligosaccharide synthase NodC [Ensifer canadensis]MBO1945095.1 chitooligosaccharide synthase NodC [Sinorhizobium medicae]MBO1960369.1 chitooligosaccharide synthase NodC [Sinorhizobium medicae]
MYLLDTTSTAAISIYALLLTAYRSMQALHARPIDGPAVSAEPVETRPLPAVDVIVPSFNEDPGILSACLASIADQDYPGELRVYVVDDGSRNREAIVRARAFYSRDPRFSFILLPENVGKRKAQIAAIGQSSGDLVLNVDSDSTIAFDVVSKLASKMGDPEVGAVMGQLTASNSGDTWLTKLIDMEYWLACNEERAAQARFGAVMCCCGPCAMYRRSALASLLDQYETQLFRGKLSDFGEDRHLTILMLKAGFRTEYVPNAIVATVVPDTLKPYLRQQLRWARSTFRDTFLVLPLLRGLNPFLTLDVVGQNIGPLLLALSVVTGLAHFIMTATVPWWTILIIASMTIIRCSVVALHARQLRFLGFVLHTPINLFLLLPLKAYALCTLSNSDWLSRYSAPEVPVSGGKQTPIQASGRVTPDCTCSGE